MPADDLFFRKIAHSDRLLGAMTHIVTTTYRDKRPARKRKAVALEGVVRKRSRADAVVPPDHVEDPTPANDDRKPAIVTTTSRKRRGSRVTSSTRRSPTTPRQTPRCGYGSNARNGAHGPAR